MHIKNYNRSCSPKASENVRELQYEVEGEILPSRGQNLNQGSMSRTQCALKWNPNVLGEHSKPMGVFDWASSVTYVLTDWMFLTILYSTGTGIEAM